MYTRKAKSRKLSTRPQQVGERGIWRRGGVYLFNNSTGGGDPVSVRQNSKNKKTKKNKKKTMLPIWLYSCTPESVYGRQGLFTEPYNYTYVDDPYVNTIHTTGRGKRHL